MRLYRLLLRAYPAPFRARYGAEMERTFALMLHEARTNGGRSSLLRAWTVGLTDLLLHALAERRASRLVTKGRVMDLLKSDLRQAVKSTFARPGLSAAAILTIALGIGANAGIFGIVNAVLLRPLPYDSPDRIVMLWERFAPMNLETMPWSVHDFIDARARSKQIESMALFAGPAMVLTGAGEAVNLDAVAVSPALFQVLGVMPALGVPFPADSEQPGKGRLVILSHAMWRDRFGSDPAIVGRSITLNDRAYNVTGVMPPGFSFPPPVTFGEQMLTESADVYVPLPLDTKVQTRGQHSYFAVGRLAPGATIASAAAELGSIAAQVGKENPRTNGDVGMHAVPLHGQSVTTIRRALLFILCAVAAVLLIACASVANLLLARATARRREMALRTALGAGRGRLMTMLLAESMVLGLAGGALGLVLANWIAQGLIAVNPIDLPELFEMRLDWRVFAFTTLATLGSVVIFGILPALQGSRTDVTAVLQSGTRIAGSRGEMRTKNVLVAAQVAIAIALMVAAGLAIRSFSRLWSVETGFSPEGVTVATLSLSPGRYADRDAQLAFQSRLLDTASALPGVSRSAVAFALPFSPDRNAGDYRVEGQPPRRDNEYQIAARQVVSNQYFDTLGIPLLEGRAFNAGDAANAPPVAVITKSLADRHWPNGSAIGRTLSLDGDAKGNPIWIRIVGVVGDVRMRGFQEPSEPMIYRPASQISNGSFWVLLRSARDSDSIARDFRAAVATLDRDMPVDTIEPLKAVMSDSVRRPRFVAALLAAFGAAALLIAAVGLYGVIAFDVARQTRDIGVRVALGASPGRVRRQVLVRALKLTLMGVALGLGAAIAGARMMQGLLFGVSPTDGPTFAMAALTMFSVALLASWLPARRATQVDPIVALRAE